MITQITKTCWQCRGTGVSRFSDNHNQCGVCHGSGKVPNNCNPTPNQTPKINDKFRFYDGTIGTIVQVVIYENGSTRYKVRMPFIQVLTPNHILKYQTFPIADLTLYQAPVTSNAIWTVKG